MPKRYMAILLTYILAQFSSYPVVWLVDRQAFNPELAQTILVNWQVFSFIVALVISIILLRKDRQLPRADDRASGTMTVVWCILGVVMALFGQAIANLIQVYLFGLQLESENTTAILEISRVFPIFILIVAIIGPILEEIIFRKIIFGELYKRTNFFIAGTISGLVFAVVHNDFTHLLVYFVISFVFAFVYVQSKRLIVPIMAHVLMNSYVVVMQLFFAEQIEQYFEEVQFIIINLIGG
ncbi:hypothetical protein SAMN04488134_10313 [Amphibacillus marinus]|uniref:CAAX prenyl protease 2/Lysostaphin resistance protein A-like domain-containing protein n=1 Tax=Amphibacillus marinus TaxID=872970 RepID=A0A1H8KYI1_9BACI|nr:type II CAAX endopeptidase family protein [Amphibacillus marinus]SEN97919.1 hypothetical protein SAMN04488134_10313 [Amphibacillus marinus]